MSGSEVSYRKERITEITWNYLLDNGLSHSSITKLRSKTKLAQSSLYYWFENKDDIWISAGKYGLAKVVNILFQFTFDHIEDIDGYFATFLDEVDKYKMNCVWPFR